MISRNRKTNHTIHITVHFGVLALLIICFAGSVQAQDVNELYVINSNAETLDRVDLITGTVDHDVATLGLYPNRIYVNDTLGIVVNSGDANLQLIDLSDFSTIGYVNFTEGDNPWEIEVVGDTAAYVSLFLANEVAYVDLVSRTVIDRISVGHRPEGLVVDGNRVYVVHTAFNDIEFVYDQGMVYVIDKPSFTVFDSVETATNPQDIVRAPDGTLHILCTGNYVDEFGTIDVLNPVSLSIVDNIPIGGSPGVIHLNRGGHVYLADFGWTQGYIYEYDARTRQVIHDSSNPIAPPGSECAYITGDMSDNFFVCHFNNDNIGEYANDDLPTGRTFAVGDGPIAAAVRTNRLPGDVNGSNTVDPVDVAFAVIHIYRGYPLPGLPAALDVNRDCSNDPLDVQFLVHYVYRAQGFLLWGCVSE